MPKIGTEDLSLDKKLEDNFRSVSEFWQKNFKADKFMAFDTARRAIKAKKHVSLNILMVIMNTLGFNRSQIVDALKKRGDNHYWPLIEQAEGVEEDLTVAERQLLDDVRRLNTSNRSLYNALTTIIHAVRSVSPPMLAASGNSVLHALAGTRVDPAMRQEFEQAIKLHLSNPDENVIKELINAQNEYKATPLICACMAGNEEIALLLIALGAKMEVKDKDDRTAFHYAYRLHLHKVVKVFKERHPEVVMDYLLD